MKALKTLNRNQKKAAIKTPTTPKDFLEDAINDEESGDRWFGSDLSKSLRFYSKAYEGYVKGLQCFGSTGSSSLKSLFDNLYLITNSGKLKNYDLNVLNDLCYNLSRLVFYVYTNFQFTLEKIKFQYLYKAKLIDLDNKYDTQVRDNIIGNLTFETTLGTRQSGVHDQDSLVLKSIDNVAALYGYIRELFVMTGYKNGWDFGFNDSLVLMELAQKEEDSNDESTNLKNESFKNALTSFGNVLGIQITELLKFVNEMNNSNGENDNNQFSTGNNEGEENDEVEAAQSDTVIPSTLLETLTSSLGCINTWIESATDEQDLGIIITLIGDKSRIIINHIIQLQKEYPTESLNLDSYNKDCDCNCDLDAVGIPLLSQSDINSASIEILKYFSTQATSLSDIEMIWSQLVIPIATGDNSQPFQKINISDDCVERYSAASDCVIEFYEKQLTIFEPQITKEDCWKIYSLASKYLSNASSKLPKDTATSSVITSQCKLLLHRADIDKTRKEWSPDDKAKQLLEKNYRIFNQNCINLSKFGVNPQSLLRETIQDKIDRIWCEEMGEVNLKAI